MTAAMRVVAGARATIGAPFRAHGRDPALGLDCVGVVVCALRAADVSVRERAYALRSGLFPEDCVPGRLARADGGEAGDILLCRAGPGQLHLAVRSENGVVHADAALRRVVERPGAVPWPIVAAWRVTEEE